MSMIGKSLAHYSITSQLGKGGMGEVYQAKDTKLGRNVAIKVLPEEFAKNSDRIIRFQREAKLLASLNHPNIAAIYGLEESDGTHFLVLELVEGQTLAERIKSGLVPVEEALKLALQIAEALEAAHEKGVIHRDLKPANIKVTPDGKVKVLDFGLAKAFAGEQADLNLSNSPTLSDMATQQGIILGTAAYMSPEQARGKEVDKRVDVWAFGVVLFEMLAGKQVFTGDTVSDTLASVLAREPEWQSLPQNIHPRIRLLLERCLKKEPTKRYRDIGDARIDIQEVLTEPSGVFAQSSLITKSHNGLRLNLPWVVAVIIVTAVIIGVSVWILKPTPLPEPRQVIRFNYELPEDQEFGDLTECAFTISPDGSQLVYATDKGLYLRSMSEMDAMLLPGTGGSMQRPFFSPDGNWIGFFSSADNYLKKIATIGGAPVPLANVNIFGSFDWDSDGTIRYGEIGSGVMGISADGGTPEQVIKSGENETIGHVQILPDGDSVLLTKALPEPVMIMVHSLKSGERRELFEGTVAKYLPNGIIVYEDGGTLWAVRFDLNSLRVIGGRIPLIEGMLRTNGAPQYAVSKSGTLAYMPGTSSSLTEHTLVWVDRKGKEEPLSAEPGDYRGLRISPDGNKVALSISMEGNQDIYIWDIKRKNRTQLTFDVANDGLPLWTPDGNKIIFTSNRKNNWGIYWKAADGTGEDELLVSSSDEILAPASWSADGKTLALDMAKYGSTLGDIGTLSLEGDKTIKPLLESEHWECVPLISPNGKWIAYMVNEPGRNPFSEYEIYVRPFPNVNDGQWKVSTNGGFNQLWSGDGLDLFYWTDDALMVVAVESEPTFTSEAPKVLLQRIPVIINSFGFTFTPWDIHPVDKRFLMLKPVTLTSEETATSAPHKITFVQNWFEELKERVPVD
jgi:serine/threonine protein kinase/Tol biopolymer transport system component